LQTSLVTIIVGKLSKWQAVLPFGSVWENAGFKHVFEDLVYPFGLSSSLRVVGDTSQTYL
jgi:hypothetical protein